MKEKCYIQEIDTDELGIVVTEWHNGVPFASRLDGYEAAKEVAQKVNEIISYLKNND